MKTVTQSAYLPTVRPAPQPRSVIGTIRRLARMPWSEVAGRGRQETAKLLDRSTASERPVDADAILRDHAPAYVDPAAALEIVRNIAPSRFFAGVENLRL